MQGCKHFAISAAALLVSALPVGATEDVCICPNGVAATGDLCTANGIEVCTTCNAGYTLNAQLGCDETEDVCICPNGVAATGDLCTIDGAEACTTCKAGYALNAQLGCDEEACICPNGYAATGDLCTTKGAEVCTTCKAGYTLNAQLGCDEDACICPNGHAATGDLCTTKGAEVCTACKAGYTLNAQLGCVEAIVAPGGEAGLVESMPVGAAADASSAAEDAIGKSASNMKVTKRIDASSMVFVASLISVGLFIGARTWKSHQYSSGDARLLIQEESAEDEDAA